MSVALVCAGVLLPAAAHAARESCGEAGAKPSACTEVLPLLRTGGHEATILLAAAPTGAAAVRPVLTSPWPRPYPLDPPSFTSAALPASSDFDANAAAAPIGSDPSLLGLLFAALGVVGFVAHRRSGR
ncbi:MAG TPA: hypothetical protein VFR90_15380 [Methylibium sp.]|uniref:hypothetical protein n=1 Tax=Methylibium sp. TaxID=2067992 RepID=UPI002DBD1BBA|nr:hypothetical protein [Methylibium sp.]HEU4460502.1 hypothetical protein [Methylibium sp.]